MAYNNHEYGSKSIYRQHMECLNTSWLTTIMSTAARVSIVNTWNGPHGLQQSWVRVPIVNTWMLMAYNNHEYGSKSIYRQHMECLNTSWLTTIMSTAARVTIVNTWNAQIPRGLQHWVRQQEYLSSTHGMLKYLMAYNNHEYGSKSIYRQHMECLNTSWLTTIMSTAARVPIVNTWNA